MMLDGPPHSIEAEEAFIGAALSDPSVVEWALGIDLVPSDFYRLTHQHVWRAVIGLYESRQPIDIVTVGNALMATDADVSLATLTEIVRAAGHVWNAQHYGALIKEKALRRDLLDAAANISALAYSEGEEVGLILDRAEDVLRRTRRKTPDAGRNPDPADIIARLEGTKVSGTPTRWPALNQMASGGMTRGHIWVIGGFAQPLDSPVLTPDGFTRMGDLAVGSKVIGSDGLAHTVVSVHPQGVIDAYEVSFSDGTSTIASASHKWFTQTDSDRSAKLDGRVRTTLEIASTVRASRGHHGDGPNHRIKVVHPVEFSERDDPVLHPYLMGLLLGDGCLKNGTYSIYSKDREIIDSVASLVPNGDHVRVSDHNSGIGWVAYISGGEGRKSPSFTRQAMGSYGLHGSGAYDKFIPDDYLMGSVKTRTDILRGLMDTDGHATRSEGCAEFSSSSETLVDGVEFIVRSLGGVARHTSRFPKKGSKVQPRLHYRVSIRLRDIVPFALPRKIAAWGNREVPLYKTISSVRQVDPVEMQCITVDASDGLYLTDGLTVTHNSSTGKSATLVNLVEDVVNTNHAAMVASTEMTSEGYLARLISLTSGIPQWIVRSGDMTLDQHAAYTRAKTFWQTAKIRVFDDLYTVARIRRQAKRMQEQIGLDCLFVDFLGNLSETGDEVKDARSSIIQLQQLAKELNIAVVVLSQLSNAMAQSMAESGLGNFYSLKGSGAVRDAGDLIVILERDRVNSPEVMTFQVAKNRHGATGRFSCWFSLETGRLTQMSEDEAAENDPNAGRRGRRTKSDVA